MTKTLLLFAALASAAFAQDLVGTWQGKLQVGKELRVVLKISKADDSSLKAVFYSIDQTGAGISANSVGVQGQNVKIGIPGIGGTIEGKLAADNQSIAATFTQGPNPIPLNLVRATPDTAWTIPEAPAKLKPMRADIDPAFEVATIKPSNPEIQGKGIRVNGVNFSTVNTSVVDLISFAYGVHARQISGGPAWFTSDRFDIAAKPDGEGQPNDRQLKIMVQKLLAERFQLKFHKEQKELSVYAITVTKTGSKLTKNESDPNGLPGLGFRGLGAMVVRNATLVDFAGTMQGAVLDRPVVDQTGLAGRYDFTLNWTPDEFQFTGLGVKVPPPPDNAPNPDLFAAIQQQLGLKLESTKAPTDVLVIDRAEKPTGN
jgi:uncharacterized protein (TIGR03435 family)